MQVVNATEEDKEQELEEKGREALKPILHKLDSKGKVVSPVSAFRCKCTTAGRATPHIVLPAQLTPGEEKLWKEFGGCYRRANNHIG